ncbi:MAG: hypothetical protein LBM92_03700, partial [Opitutaceae bacterium]|nr:hypothetical protein [Opitutaceae bacterium]
HEAEDDARNISAEIGGSQFTVRARKPKEQGLITSFALDAALSPKLTAWLGLACERTTALKSATDANAGLMWKF